jgi:hypothetical protein
MLIERFASSDLLFELIGWRSKHWLEKLQRIVEQQ